MGQRDRVVVVLWMVVLWQIMGRCAERQEPWGCWAVRSFNFRQASTRTRFDISLGRYLKPVSWRSVAVHQGAPEPVVVARAMRRGRFVYVRMHPTLVRGATGAGRGEASGLPGAHAMVHTSC